MNAVHWVVNNDSKWERYHKDAIYSVSFLVTET